MSENVEGRVWVSPVAECSQELLAAIQTLLNITPNILAIYLKFDETDFQHLKNPIDIICDPGQQLQLKLSVVEGFRWVKLKDGSIHLRAQEASSADTLFRNTKDAALADYVTALQDLESAMKDIHD